MTDDGLKHRQQIEILQQKLRTRKLSYFLWGTNAGLLAGAGLLLAAYSGQPTWLGAIFGAVTAFCFWQFAELFYGKLDQWYEDLRDGQ